MMCNKTQSEEGRQTKKAVRREGEIWNEGLV